MTSGWGLNKGRPARSQKYNTPNLKMDNEAVLQEVARTPLKTLVTLTL